MFFNPDMDARLRDLHQALEAGDAIEVQSLPAFEHLSARVRVRFGERQFVLANEMASQVADQVEANGWPVFASRLRPEQ
ncbi:MAG: hypothetical protein WC718_01500 [Phycisphaerales bacterium]|jgi:hypothetical protein